VTNIQGISNDEREQSKVVVRKIKFSEHDLDDLREHIDAVSFNLGKVYHHAKDRSRKQSFRNSLKKKFHHIYKNEKSGF
jgi:hypothetical protein